MGDKLEEKQRREHRRLDFMDEVCNDGVIG